MNSTTDGGEIYGDKVSELCSENPGEYLGDSQCDLYGPGIGYTISYNFTALHAAVSNRFIWLKVSRKLIPSGSPVLIFVNLFLYV